MAISSPGIGSNLDVNSIVSQLMSLERRPLTQLDRKEASYQAQLSAYGSLKGAISSFQSSLAGLRNPSRFESFRAQTGNAAVISATAASTAASGNYTVTVNALALPHVLQTAGAASTTTASSTGSITLQSGSGAIHAVTIDAGNNTLAGVRDAINAAQSDVRAVIINDGSATPYRLVLTASDGGSSNAITVNHTLTAGALRDAFDGLSTAQTAVDASVTVNGVVITGAGNTLADAIPGISLQLSGTGTTSLSVTRDTGAIQSAAQGFVKAYNDLSGALASLTAYNATTKQAGPLAGNSSALGVQAQIRAALGNALPGLSGPVTRLSQIGIEFKRDGLLALDAAKLDAAIAANPNEIGGLFALRARSDSNLLQYARSGAETTAGSYEVQVGAAATQAAVTAAAPPAASTVIDNSNDTFTFELDGVASGSVQIAHGTYAPAALGDALQAAIDGSAALDAAGAAATVTLSGGTLAINSVRYGDASQISALGGSALASLGFSGGETASGTDLEGHFVFNGQEISATGTGQELTAAAGAPADGLSVRYSGTAGQLLSGAEGTLNLSEGYAVILNRLATRFLETNGTINSRTEGIGRSIDEISRQRERLNLRMNAVEARIRAQFTALDTLLGRMSTTSNFLTQQLANLPSTSK